jgi:ATP-binding cassette subfamily B protein
MSQVQDFISMAFLLTALIAFNPWLILLYGYYSFLGESYFNSKNYALSRSQTQKEENWITCVIWELVTKLQRK